MRVVLLTHYYVPEVGAAQVRIAALARALAERGIDVTVHTGLPSYPAGRIPSPYRNGLLRRERVGEVRVLRSLTYPVPNVGFAKRVANHAVLAASTVLTSPASGRVDVVVAETPPLFMAAAGVLYARAKGAALALNVSDRWPESAIQLGALEQPQARRAAEWLERWVYRHAQAITAPTRGIIDTISSLPEAAGKTVHVPPAVDVARFAAVAPVAPARERPLRVLYAGTLGMAQGIEQVLEAARSAGPDVVELRIAGDGPDRDLVISTRLPHVRYLGSLTAADIAPAYAWADVSVVPLRDREIFAGALPTKLFESLAAGRPVVLAGRGEAARLLDDGACGVVVPPEDPGRLAAVFGDLQRDPHRTLAMGERGRAVARAYDRANAVDAWIDVLDAITPDGRR